MTSFLKGLLLIKNENLRYFEIYTTIIILKKPKGISTFIITFT